MIPESVIAAVLTCVFGSLALLFAGWAVAEHPDEQNRDTPTEDTAE